MASPPVTVGELSPLKSVFKWKIGNFDTYLKHPGTQCVSLSSPEFLAGGKEFYLNLRIGDCENKSDISLYIRSKHSGNILKTNVSFSILNKEDTKCYQRIFGIVDIKKGFYGFVAFTKREYLVNKKDTFLANNELSILCELYPTAYNKCNESLFNFEQMLIGNKCLNNFELIIGNQRLYAHKEILSRKSDVFAAMFAHNVVENATNSVVIEDLDYDTVVEMLRFMYTGEVKSIKNIVEKLLTAADKYALMDLCDVCRDYLLITLSLQNAVHYFGIAIRYNFTELKTKVRSFIIENAHEMIDLPEFKSLLKLQDDVLLDIIAELARRGNRHSDSPDIKKRKVQ